MAETTVEEKADVTVEEPTDFAEYRRFRETGELEKASSDGEDPEKATPSEPPEETSKGESESGGESDTPAEQEKKQHRKPDAERRIAELTRKRKEAEARAEAAERKLAGLEKPTEKKSEPDKPRPKLDDFDTHEDYEDALYEWREARRTAKQAEVDGKTKAEQAKAESAKAAEMAVMARWNEHLARAGEQFDDFAEVIKDADVKISGVMVEAIADSEAGPQLINHLARNSEEAERIAGLSPAAQLRAIGRLEAQLSTPAKPKPKTSTAPAPAKPVGGGTSAKNLEAVTDFDEYKARRREQMKAA